MSDPILIELPDSFDTARLVMRPPRSGDGAALLPALTESLASLRRYLASLPWVAGDPTLATCEAFCRNGRSNFLGRKDFPFLIFEKSSGELVGQVGLHRVDWAVPKAEIGYWMRSSRTGRGYTGEAVHAACAYAFEHLRAVRLEIFTDAENTPSRRVAERCGFALEGVLRDERRDPLSGSLRATCIYGRLA